MPHRVFNIKEVAAYLHLSTTYVQELVRTREIPHEKQGDRLTFRKKEIEGWASRRILQLPEKRLTAYHSGSSARTSETHPHGRLIPHMLAATRINPELTSKTRTSVIRDMAALADTTGLVSDLKELIESLEEREKLCSTAMPNRFALLHPRHHDPYMFSESFIVLGRSIQAVHFGALDGLATNLFFLVCCQDDRIHLHTLARLCAMCQQTPLLDTLLRADTASDMFEALLRAEQDIVARL